MFESQVLDMAQSALSDLDAISSGVSELAASQSVVGYGTDVCFYVFSSDGTAYLDFCYFDAAQAVTSARLLSVGSRWSDRDALSVVDGPVPLGTPDELETVPHDCCYVVELTYSDGDVAYSQLYSPYADAAQLFRSVVEVDASGQQLFTRDEATQMLGDFSFLGIALFLVLVLQLGATLFLSFRLR